MTSRILFVLFGLFTASLLIPPAMASQPSGLAGEFITETNLPDTLLCPDNLFEAYMYFGPRTLDPADTLTLEMALVPFSSGETGLGFDDATGGTFMGVVFSDGDVDGLPYNRFGWNDVIVRMRPATQDFILRVNGAEAGPFPYDSSCQDSGGCFTPQAFRMDNGSPSVGGAIAWIDTLSISRESPLGVQVFARRTFDFCAEGAGPSTVGGALLTENPPSRLRTKK